MSRTTLTAGAQCRYSNERYRLYRSFINFVQHPPNPEEAQLSVSFRYAEMFLLLAGSLPVSGRCGSACPHQSRRRPHLRIQN